MTDMFDLSGKTALITGGGSGLGAAIAQGLSDAGARIVLAARRRERLEEALGDREGTIFPVDLMEPTAIQELHDFCQEQQMMPDIVVSAVGINMRQPADDVDADGWHRTMQLNLTAPFFTAQAFVPVMKERGWGRVINIASLQSNRAFANSVAYGSAKGGVAQMTRAMAEAWSPHGIMCNALGPGFFPTELTAAVFGNEELAAKNAAQTAIGRNGDLADIVGPAVFLASPASDYVTGQLLYVDGGFTAK
ncbi:MAG: SDR family oxidoreductase [Pseudomonadota bacterium]